MAAKKTSRKPAQPPATGGYTPRERAIYRYFNGVREVAVDPLRVQRELAAVPDLDLETDAKLAGLATPNPESAKSFDRLVEAVRKVFQVQPLSEDGIGLTDAECVELLASFALYIADVKKKAQACLTSAPPTEPTSSPAG